MNTSVNNEITNDRPQSQAGRPAGDDIWKFLRPSIERYASNVAWKMRLAKGETRSVTYAEILRATEALAGRLKGRGVGAGDIVGVMAPNGPEWSAAALAIWRLGAILAPVHIGGRQAQSALSL